MATNIYDIGDEVRMSALFTVSNIATDPSTVVMKVKKPDGTIQDHSTSVQHASTGNFYIDVVLDMSGRWYFRYEGTGTVITAGERIFDVRKKRVS